MKTLTALTDNDLLTRAQLLAKKERALLTVFLEHLIEIERRRLHERGHSSLFYYLVRELRYSESAAGRRVAVARLCARVPQVLDAIRQGDLHLCGANRLAAIITTENAHEILGKISGKSMSQIEQIVVGYVPKPIVRDGISPQQPARDIPAPATVASVAMVGEQSEPPQVMINKKDEVKPATSEIFNIRFAAKRDFVEKLERAQEILSNSTDGSYEEILEKVLDAYLAKHDPLLKEPKAAPERAKPAPEQSRYIPKSVRILVTRRDQARCSHIDPTTGRRCDARRHLQFDHIIPFARGGSSRDPSNLRLLCSTHNRRAARAIFGADWVADKIAPTIGSSRHRQLRELQARRPEMPDAFGWA